MSIVRENTQKVRSLLKFSLEGTNLENVFPLSFVHILKEKGLQDQYINESYRGCLKEAPLRFFSMLTTSSFQTAQTATLQPQKYNLY